MLTDLEIRALEFIKKVKKGSRKDLAEALGIEEAEASSLLVKLESKGLTVATHLGDESVRAFIKGIGQAVKDGKRIWSNGQRRLAGVGLIETEVKETVSAGSLNMGDIFRYEGKPYQYMGWLSEGEEERVEYRKITGTPTGRHLRMLASERVYKARSAILLVEY